MLFRAWRVSYTLGRGQDGDTTVAGSDGALVDTHRARRAIEYSLQIVNMFREAFLSNLRRCLLRVRLLVDSC